MEVIDLREEHRALFSCCLEDWSDEAREGAPRRARWVERFLPRGLRARLAVADDGRIGGMIQYLPIEQSMVDGAGLYFIPCIWVHGHAQGRGDFQGHGMGSALLEAAEADARAMGASGLAAWGLWLPFWMKASWFKKHGFRAADRQGLSVLLWKPFDRQARPPRWFQARPPPMERVEGKVTVTAFTNGWCLANNLTLERLKRAAAEHGDKVLFREIDTSEHAVAARWGLCDQLYIDGKPLSGGPPRSFERLRAMLARRVKRLGS